MSQKEFIPQLASIEQRQAHTQHIWSKLAVLQARPRDTLSDKPEDHYHIGQTQNFPEDLMLFVRKNSDDPLTEVLSQPWQLATHAVQKRTQSQHRHTRADASKCSSPQQNPSEWASDASTLATSPIFVKSIFALHLLYLDSSLSLHHIGILMYPSTLRPSHLTFYV